MLLLNLIDKIKKLVQEVGLFIKKMMIKVELSASMTKVRDYLQAVQRTLLEDERFRTITIYYDVDPQ